MGPFHEHNVSSACGTCNLMKGCRRIRSFVNLARTIATHRGGVGDFGRFPEAFRNNVSRRSRSSYISASSTHTKTHALTNEAFARIVSQPCRFCGKPHDPPRHYNGLDRLDSACRVYTEDTCVACCGDCNMAKYTHSESAFIAHCVAIARHNIGVDSFLGDEVVAANEDVEDAEQRRQHVEEAEEDGEEGGEREREDTCEAEQSDDGRERDKGSGVNRGGDTPRAAFGPEIVAWDAWGGSDGMEDEDEEASEQDDACNPFAAFALPLDQRRGGRAC